MYADVDVEFLRGQPAHLTTATDRILPCTVNVKAWMSSHDLLLNVNKTEVIIISAVNNRKRVQPSVDQVFDLRGCAVTSKRCIRDIDVLLDNTMSIMNQVHHVCQVAYCHPHSITLIRRCLTANVYKTIVNALIMSHLDYCNAMLYGLPETQLRKLQMVQNSAAHLITGTKR